VSVEHVIKLVCSVCEKEGKDVAIRPDPFFEDVHDTLLMKPLCDKCERELAEDI
jgi:hypothetical protein